MGEVRIEVELRAASTYVPSDVALGSIFIFSKRIFHF